VSKHKKQDLVLLPADEILERQVIGGVLVGGGGLWCHLSEEDFNLGFHRVIWRAMSELRADGSGLSIDALIARLSSRAPLTQQDTAYLGTLLDEVIAEDAGTLRTRATTLRELRVRRELIKAADGDIKKACDRSENITQLLERRRAADELLRERLRQPRHDGDVPDGAELLEDLIAHYRKYVRVAEDEYDVAAVWVLHCHAFKCFSTTPYINVTSATNGCGKTRLLEITEPLVPEGLLVSHATGSALARAIDEFHPVLLIDEFDQLRSGDRDLFAAVLAMVNSGYKKSGYRLVNLPQKGQEWKPGKQSTFSPKMLSGISILPPATQSRCIPIAMERMLPGDRVAETDEYITEPEARELFDRAERWAEASKERLRLLRPDSPPELGHRQREVSRPLFAIGDVVGGVWPERIRSAVVRLFANRDAVPTNDIKVELLHDIRLVFRDRDRITSKELSEELAKLEDRPWAAWGKAHKPISQTQVANLLGDFKVVSGSVRIGDRTPKGYYRRQFEQVWRRYPTHTPVSAATPPQPASLLNETHFLSRNTEMSVAAEKCEKTAPLLACGGVAAKQPEGGWLEL